MPRINPAEPTNTQKSLRPIVSRAMPMRMFIIAGVIFPQEREILPDMGMLLRNSLLGLTEDGSKNLRLQLGAGLPFVLIVITLSCKLVASIYKLVGFLLLA